MREIKHLSVHQWLRSAIPDSQQPTSPIGFLFLKLPPPPCAVLLVYKSAGLTACLIGRCCSCFCSWLVLVPLFSCCAFLLRLNQGTTSTRTRARTSAVLVLVVVLVLLPTTTTPTTTATTTTPPPPTPTPTPTPTPLPLVVPETNDTAYSITVIYRYSSQDAHGTDRPVLIWYVFHWLFKHALATQAASDLRLCLGLFFSQAST